MKANEREVDAENIRKRQGLVTAVVLFSIGGFLVMFYLMMAGIVLMRALSKDADRP